MLFLILTRRHYHFLQILSKPSLSELSLQPNFPKYSLEVYKEPKSNGTFKQNC